MKKRNLAVAAGVLVMAVGGTAVAANLANLNGQGCADGYIGNYHFVNNQVPAGSGTGTLWATFDSGDSCQVSSYKVLTSVQHFRCFGTGDLTGASTNLGGRLVLSDYTCTRQKCDPKVDKECQA